MSRTQEAVESLAKGEDISSLVGGQPEQAETISEEAQFNTDDFLGDVKPEEPKEATEPEPELAGTDERPSEEKEAPQGDFEEIVFNDGKGRRKVKVDFSDRKQMKKLASMAYGHRKYQAERDKLKSELEQIQPDYQDLKETWSALEKAYTNDGIKGLVNLIAGEEDAFDKWSNELYEKKKHRENASAEELEKLDIQERAEREAKEKARLQKQMEDLLRQQEEAKEKTELSQLESQIHPAFSKYRFSGKLGNANLETRLDKAIWTQALDALNEMPDDVELTPQVIDREFRKAANDFRQVIKTESNKQVKTAVNQRKRVAQTNAAVKAVKGYNQSTSQDKFKKDIRSGNYASALTDLLSGKFKF